MENPYNFQFLSTNPISKESKSNSVNNLPSSNEKTINKDIFNFSFNKDKNISSPTKIDLQVQEKNVFTSSYLFNVSYEQKKKISLRTNKEEQKYIRYINILKRMLAQAKMNHIEMKKEILKLESELKKRK